MKGAGLCCLSMGWSEEARHPRLLLAYVVTTSVGLGLAGGFLYGIAVGVATFVVFLPAGLLGLRFGARLGRRLRR